MNSPFSPSLLLPGLRQRIDSLAPAQEAVRGRVVAIQGVTVRAMLPIASMGEICLLRDPRSGRAIQAEVIGLDRDEVILSPIGDLDAISLQAEVIAEGKRPAIAGGDHLLGRVIDALGEGLDGPVIAPLHAPRYPLRASPPPPLTRANDKVRFTSGIRCIDGMLTLAKGQRVGIFGEPGVGKSSLLAGLVRHAQVDVVVFAMIGERGREVRDFLEQRIDAAARARTVAVVSTSDRPAAERVMAAYTATAVAEYFRDQGLHVLLLMDSVTRFARAQRELGLAAGEPPTRRGYPPSFFAALPRLLERAGYGSTGAITALYTVLTEGEAALDPVAEETASILDGHIYLAERLARRNHFPAVDILRSRSRLMDDVVSQSHGRSAAALRDALANLEESELLRQVGEYQTGQDPMIDRAIRNEARIKAFLQQNLHQPEAFNSTLQQLQGLLS